MIYEKLHTFIRDPNNLNAMNNVLAANFIEENFNKLLDILLVQNNIDILCLQEVCYENKPEYKIFKSLIGRYLPLYLKSICKSHKLGWSSSIKMNSHVEEPHLGNAIYAKSGQIFNFKKISDQLINSTENIISEPGIDERCCAIFRNKQRALIASTHLSGGRFEDKDMMKKILKANKLTYDPLIENPKIKQLLTILSNKDMVIDILCGDFNTKYGKPPKNIETGLPLIDGYTMGILTELKTKNEITEAEYLAFFGNDLFYISAWNNWMYMSCGDGLLFADKSMEYVLVESKGYLNSFTPGESNYNDTTKFGGIVDYIFYNKITIDKKGSSRLLNGYADIMAKQSELAPFFTDILSDHLPIGVELIKKSKPIVISSNPSNSSISSIGNNDRDNNVESIIKKSKN
jgi:endonuclease/exonuclease/phosphatase family metal-dependent hydrolase